MIPGCMQHHDYIGLSLHSSTASSIQRPVARTFSIRASTLTNGTTRSPARQRRKERNERREQLKTERTFWREQVEEKEMEKKKTTPKGLKYDLDMSRLTARGMQWWMVLVPMRYEVSMAETISSVLSCEFPDEDFEVYVPLVPTKRKMKDGSISSSTQALHNGCVFLRCVLRRAIHNAVKRVPRVRGFFGKRVGFHEIVVMPTPVPIKDIEGMRKKVKEEDEDYLRLKELAEEEKKMKRAAAAVAAAEEGRKSSIEIGSNVQVLDGPYANFEGRVLSLPDADNKVEVSVVAFGEIVDVVLSLEEIEVLSKAT